MPSIANHLKYFTESVIREMTRVSNECGAINLSQGFPDFDPPAELVAAAKRALEQGFHQYAITWGAAGFREALARKQRYWMGLDLDPDTNIVVTCGSTEAMMVAMMTVCNPGDKVIVFSPFYENYGADTILTGAKPIYVPLHPPGFNFDPDELRNAFKQGVKALVLCNPSNPTGKVFTREELQYIADLAQEFDAYILTDEVYEHIVYAPHTHTYIASLPGMFERTVSCSSLSKTYAITGWRLGYVIASQEVIEGAKKVHDFLTVGAASPLQEAAVTALNFPLSYYEQLQNEYTRLRDCFLGYLDQTGLPYTIPQGAYYVLADISDFDVKDDTAFCRWLAKEIGVAAVPGSSFFHESVNHLIRFHFAKREDTLKAAGERLLKLKERG
ncbi:pyridoxal phosphate-dependent aminotransferase [Desulfonema magnum]|uniref:Aminotransferase n=1 Tax=Desulfonema magnum TaxID=45655 RepID=A0A975BR33_9BACT|nr:aminotransferase class I/II-fold pyridoxal phosphate-dependent enzyme [Desulfonema magnum]QTA89838.1 Aminotransferase, class I and II [Desulfonema magnum]